MADYILNMFYWLQDRSSKNYLIGQCFDATGKFKLDESGTEVDTEEVKPIGPASKPLAHYVGEQEVDEWIHKRLE